MPDNKKAAANSSLTRLCIISAVLVILDQATKLLVMQYIPQYSAIPVIEGFFNLTHVHNPGGAFGVFASSSPVVRNFFFIGVALVALGLVFYFYRTTPRNQPFLSFAFALIFSGAIGNLIDRIRFGKVVDFLDFYAGGWHWPAFNVADSAITVGICICAYHFVFNKMP